MIQLYNSYILFVWCTRRMPRLETSDIKEDDVVLWTNSDEFPDFHGWNEEMQGRWLAHRTALNEAYMIHLVVVTMLCPRYFVWKSSQPMVKYRARLSIVFGCFDLKPLPDYSETIEVKTIASSNHGSGYSSNGRYFESGKNVEFPRSVTKILCMWQWYWILE